MSENLESNDPYLDKVYKDHKEKFSIECFKQVDAVFMEHGTEAGLKAIGVWLANADLSAGGHTGRLTGEIIERLAEWDW